MYKLGTSLNDETANNVCAIRTHKIKKDHTTNDECVM